MPVSVITDVITWIEMGAQLTLSGIELGVLNYLVFQGGWLDMARKISFWLDALIIKYIDKFYSYFDKMLGGKLFTPEVVERVMNGVYVFVTLLVLFKVMMLFMKYIVNPEMVSDDKIGAASLVKRAILGMCLMLFLPTIFTLGTDLQAAILSDNVFGKILLTGNQLRTYEKNKDQMGRVLAFNVYQAFWNLDKSQVTDSQIISSYDNAIAARDPEVFGDINRKFGEDYAIDYFPIASTVVLLYVIYLIIKYCIDIVVRMFKLFLLQMIGPLAIADYMVNGDSKDMFKSWVKTTISAYAMLFMRVFSIWFVAFVTILMNEPCTEVGTNGVCKDSMLYMVNGNQDYLLRALITLGLLAFLMDLPKLLSEIFGLDLEQDASVKGLMNKVGGAAKMVGLGAVAAGGAAIGGAIGTMKAGSNALKQFGANKAKRDLKLGKLDPNDANYDKKTAAINKQFSMENRALAGQVAGAQGGFATGVMAAALSKSTVGGTATGAYSSGVSSTQNKSQEYANNQKATRSAQDGVKEIEDKEAEQLATEQYRSGMLNNSAMQLQQQQILNAKMGIVAGVDTDVEVIAKGNAMKTAGVPSVMDRLGSLDTTTQASAKNIVEINENTEVIRNNSSESVKIAGEASAKLSDISTHTEVTADNIVEVNANTKVISDNTTESLITTEEINENVRHISTTVDKIEDETFYSGMAAIESLNDGDNSQNKKSNAPTEGLGKKSNSSTDELGKKDRKSTDA